MCFNKNYNHDFNIHEARVRYTWPENKEKYTQKVFRKKTPV